MISPEMIHDALTLLPEDLIEPVDALRRRKRSHWKPVAAVAACLCLAVGLWLLAPGITADNSGTAADDALSDSTAQESGSVSYLTATVQELDTDCIRVMPEGLSALIAVSLTQLEEIPELSVGQTIRIYCEEAPDESIKAEKLTPYRIEIVENQP